MTDRGGPKPGKSGLPRREEPHAGRAQAQRPLRLKSLLTALEPHIGWMTEEQRRDLMVAIDGGDLARAQDHLTQLQERYPKNLTIKKTLGLFRAEAVARLEEVLGGLHTVPRKTSLFPPVRTPERTRIAAAIDGLTPVEGILRKSKVDRLRGLEAIASWFRSGALEIIDASLAEAVEVSRSMRVEPTGKSALESQPPPPLWDDSETTQRYEANNTPIGPKGKYALALEEDATVRAPLPKTASRPTPPEPRLTHTSPPPPATLPFSTSERAPAQRTGLRALGRAARSFDRPTKTLRGLEAPKLPSDIEGALPASPPEEDNDRTTSQFGEAGPPEELPGLDAADASVPVVSAAPVTVTSAGAPSPVPPASDDLPPVLASDPPRDAAPTLLSESDGEEAAPRPEPPPAEETADAATSTNEADAQAPKVASAAPPAQRPTEATIARPPPAKRGLWPFALGAGAIAAVAAFALVDFGGGDPRPAPSETTAASEPTHAAASAPTSAKVPVASTSASAVQSTSVTASASASAQTQSVKVTLQIEPHFAKVLLDGKALPKKTKEITLPRDGKEHEIRVESAGYRKRKLKVTADRDTHLVITLEVIPKAQKPQPLYE